MRRGLCAVKNKELSTSPGLGQAGLVLPHPLHPHRVEGWLQGLGQVAFHVLGSPGEGWSCPAQLQGLGEDVTESQPAQAAPAAPSGPVGLLQTAPKSAGITEPRGLFCCSHSCLGCLFRLLRAGRSPCGYFCPCGYCMGLFHTRHCCSESLGTKASVSSSAEPLQH